MRLSGIRTGCFAFSLWAAAIAPAFPQIYLNTASDLPGATVSVPYSETLVAEGGTPPYTFSITSGSLPSGLSMDSGGTISGTTTAVGGESFTIQVVDSANVSTSGDFTLNVAAQPLALSAPNVTITVGQYSDFEWYPSGGDPIDGANYQFATVSGSLPPGILFPNGSSFCCSTAGFGGVPTTAGTYTLVGAVIDADFRVATASTTITVNPEVPLSAPTTSSASLLTGATISVPLTSNGGYVPITWTASGALPAGLQVTSDGFIQGVFTGSGGPDATTVTATDGLGATVTTVVSWTYPSPSQDTITTSPTLPTAVVGNAYSQTLTVVGPDQEVTWLVTSGTLPPGINLDSGGTLAGTPTTTGTYSFTITAYAGGDTAPQQTFQLTVSPTLFTVPQQGPFALNQGQFVAFAIAYPGYPGFRVVAGALPPGTTEENIAAEGVPITPGTYNYTAQYTQSDGQIVTQQQSAVVAPTPALQYNVGPPFTGFVGASYDYFLTGCCDFDYNGGADPVTYTVTDPSALPPGLQLFTNGEIYGVPTQVGIYNFTLVLSDGAGNTLQQPLTLAIDPYLSPVIFTNPIHRHSSTTPQ